MTVLIALALAIGPLTAPSLITWAQQSNPCENFPAGSLSKQECERNVRLQQLRQDTKGGGGISPRTSARSVAPPEAVTPEGTREADRLMLPLLAGNRTAVGELEAMGARGIGRADTVLALAYQEGKLGARDLERAASLYRRAAERGDVLAQYRFSEMLQEGEGVPRDLAQAERWIVRAAEQGQALAQTYAFMTFKKRVEPVRPIAEILHDFTQWAEDGNVLAMFDLSYRYEVGRHVGKDLPRATAWMQRAAAAGFAHAQSMLGTKYLTGTGLPANAAEAAKWYLKAAEQGDRMAQFFLGTMYEAGRGVPHDRTKAIEYFEKAAAQGVEPAKDLAERLRKNPLAPPNDWTVKMQSGPVQ